jgi:ADP-ribosylglycohydrolase
MLQLSSRRFDSTKSRCSFARAEAMSLPLDHEQRLARARNSLQGLSVGDAFGECFFWFPLEARALPPAPWRYTDDTAMALGIVEVLERFGAIDEDALAQVFARNYAAEPWRGYGSSAHQVLHAIGSGVAWRQASCSAFGGEGSMGNGSAMRVAPLGAYFADDFAVAAEQARLSAEVTHTHPEGLAGAIAAAVAAAWVARGNTKELTAPELLDVAIEYTPESATRAGLVEARALDLTSPVQKAAKLLGNGSRVIAQDTVPFALWCAARHIDDYKEALWSTVEAGGDRDTNCAIVGGIVATASPIPKHWLAARGPLPMLY